jgi:hypothetical protein
MAGRSTMMFNNEIWISNQIINIANHSEGERHSQLLAGLLALFSTGTDSVGACAMTCRESDIECRLLIFITLRLKALTKPDRAWELSELSSCFLCVAVGWLQNNKFIVVSRWISTRMMLSCDERRAFIVVSSNESKFRFHGRQASTL